MLEMGNFKQIHADRRCWIVGNGPSLNSMDLGFLQREISFGMNCIFLGYERFGFRPTYYTVEDVFVAEDNHLEINEMKGMVKFIPEDLGHCLKFDAESCRVNFIRHYKPYPRFSEDAAAEVFWGSTVTYLAIQLAYYMGCDPIYLIGVDYEYTVPAHAHGLEEITSQEEDVNHFDPAYFGPGKRWHHPRLDRVLQSYREAQRFLAERSRSIYNATVGGKLEVFPRVDFQLIMQTS